MREAAKSPAAFRQAGPTEGRMMEYSIGELIDRTAINKIKAERLGSEATRVAAAQGLREIAAHGDRIVRLTPREFEDLMQLMELIHGYIWDRRRFVGTAREGDLSNRDKMLIAHYAIDASDFNHVRRLIVELIDRWVT